MSAFSVVACAELSTWMKNPQCSLIEIDLRI